MGGAGLGPMYIRDRLHIKERWIQCPDIHAVVISTDSGAQPFGKLLISMAGQPPALRLDNCTGAVAFALLAGESTKIFAMSRPNVFVDHGKSI